MGSLYPVSGFISVARGSTSRSYTGIWSTNVDDRRVCRRGPFIGNNDCSGETIRYNRFNSSTTEGCLNTAIHNSRTRPGCTAECYRNRVKRSDQGRCLPCPGRGVESEVPAPWLLPYRPGSVRARIGLLPSAAFQHQPPVASRQHHCAGYFTEQLYINIRKIKRTRKQTNPPLSIQCQILKFVGHIIRREGLEKIIIQGKVQSKKNRGRPPTRFIDKIKDLTRIRPVVEIMQR